MQLEHTSAPTTSRSVVLGYAVAIGSACGLLALVLLKRTPLTYDEPWYLRTVDLIHRHGLGSAFVRELPGPAGPLYTVVHWVLEPVTALQVPGVRLVNCGLLALSLAGVAVALRRADCPTPALSAAGLLGIPMLITTAGLALTEMPAIAFATWGVALLFVALDESSTVKGHLYAATAGMCLGLSALGRQPLVLVLGCAPLLLVGSKRRLSSVLTFILAGAVLPISLFLIWGGLVPKATAFTSGFSVTHGLLSCGYGLVVLLLLSPQVIVMPWRLAVTTLCLVVGANLAGAWYEFLPLRTALEHVLPGYSTHVVARALGGVFLAAGMLFVVALVRRFWAVRANGKLLFISACALLLILANAKVAHLFSSRYVAPAAPFLGMMDLGSAYDSRWRPARLGLGAAAGLLSLWTYLAS